MFSSQTITKPLLQMVGGSRPNRTPVWFMRQAGRYLPEYQKIRAKLSFLELCQSPKDAAEVTLQPLRRFDLDAAIVFSDILVPPMALGQSLTFDQGHGPVLTPPIRSEKDLAALNTDHLDERWGFLGETLTLVQSQLPELVTLIGFAGGPFTVASYMIEGKASKDFTHTKRFMYQQPQGFLKLMEILGEVTSAYLKMQIRAGAEILMLFDTWAGQLSKVDYLSFVLPSTAKLMREIRDAEIPLIYYPGQGLDRILYWDDWPFDVLSCDWRLGLDDVLKEFERRQVFKTTQGNLDPQMFLAPEKKLRERVRGIMEEGTRNPAGHIFNVGHGLLPHTPIDALGWCVDEVRKFSP